MEYIKEYSKINYQLFNNIESIPSSNDLTNIYPPNERVLLNLESSDKILSRPLQTLSDTGENLRSQQIFITKYNCVNY